MAFTDEITIHAQAGRGGDGVVRWRKEIFEPMGGPAGGNGGKGGNVIARSTRTIKTLNQYREKNSFKASDGEAGGNRSKQGASGEDVILSFPFGTVITNNTTGEIFRLMKEGDEATLLQGGNGGRGNESFKRSTNTTPYESTPGKEGEGASFFVELELFADIGLIGLPNAGKSSLLNTLTNAKAKVGDYAFTTLDPNLGDYEGYTIADIPGLIEGAHEGKGLGTKFLRHIKHTRILMHLISLENEATEKNGVLKAYKEIREELKEYGYGLEEKEEIIVLTKTDVVEDKKLIAKKVKEFEKLDKKVFTISLFDDDSLKKLRDSLVKILKG